MLIQLALLLLLQLYLFRQRASAERSGGARVFAAPTPAVRSPIDISMVTGPYPGFFNRGG